MTIGKPERTNIDYVPVTLYIKAESYNQVQKAFREQRVNEAREQLRAALIDSIEKSFE